MSGGAAALKQFPYVTKTASSHSSPRGQGSITTSIRDEHGKVSKHFVVDVLRVLVCHLQGRDFGFYILLNNSYLREQVACLDISNTFCFSNRLRFLVELP